MALASDQEEIVLLLEDQPQHQAGKSPDILEQALQVPDCQ